MYKNYKTLVFAALVVIFSTDLSSQRFVNEFLNIGVGAEAHGLSGSVVATTNDVTAAYWNPAGLTGIKAPLQASAMHANWFGGVSNYDYLGIAKVLNEEKGSVASLSIIRLGIDNIPNTLNLIGPDGTVDYDQVTAFSASDYAFMGSYATKFKGNWSIGGSIKVIKRTIGSFANAWGFGADLGLQYKKANWNFGIMGRDITSTFNAWNFSLTEAEQDVFLATGNDIPVSSTEIAKPRIVLAAAYVGNRGSFGYRAETDFNISTDGREAGIIGSESFIIEPTFGLELNFNKKVFIRGGFGNIQRSINSVNAETLEIQPNIGLGVNLGRLRIDYALSNVNESAGLLKSHIFSVLVDFNKKNSSIE